MIPSSSWRRTTTARRGLFALPPAALRGQCRAGAGGRGKPGGGSHRHHFPRHGIRFINDGPSAEAPSEDRDPYQPETYGERWAPLLISWTTPEAAPKLKGQVIGTGGSTHYSFDGGPKTFVTGSLDLDAPQIAGELERPQGAAYATAVILHELCHVMGLEHVDDPLQLMYPEIGTPDGLAAGDLNGLYQLGQAPAARTSSSRGTAWPDASNGHGVEGFLHGVHQEDPVRHGLPRREALQHGPRRITPLPVLAAHQHHGTDGFGGSVVVLAGVLENLLDGAGEPGRKITPPSQSSSRMASRTALAKYFAMWVAK